MRIAVAMLATVGCHPETRQEAHPGRQTTAASQEAGSGVRDWVFVPPPHIGVVNVRDYGAKGDGVTDDTEAIRRAISDNIDHDRYRASAFIYFPDGVYRVTGPIESRIQHPEIEDGRVWSAGWRAGLTLIGQSRAGTIIRLADHAAGYQDPNHPRWVIATGSESDDRRNFAGGGNRAFRHGILNLTVDVGRGNPGAIGIDLVVSNRGTVENVTIRAEPGSGAIGLNLTRRWPGPGLVADVEIIGFDKGIAVGHYQYSMTFENVCLRGQRVIGIENPHNVLAMRRVEFEGDVPFYTAASGHSMLCLLDSELRGVGAASGIAAISSAGLLNLRRVKVTGFGRVVDALRREDADVPAAEDGATFIQRHDQGFVLNASGGEAVPLDLPIEDVPLVRPPPGTAWTDGGTDGLALQAAIDSGAEWIALRPRTTIRLERPLILRNRVRLILGMNGHLKAEDGVVPAVRVEEGASPVVAMEHVCVSGIIEQASRRTFAFRHGDHGGYRATGGGKTFIADVIGRGYVIGPDHSFWARQLNAEFGDDPLLINHGTAWVLGFKMESSTRGDAHGSLGTPVLVNRGGQIELFGALLYTLGNRREQAPAVPAFTNERGRIAVSYRVNGVPDTHYPIILRVDDFKNGADIVPASQIHGPGAALLTDER